jgi:large subunit ribosomal protein L35
MSPARETGRDEIMPKLKTHRGAAKRFKKTGTGKFVRSKAFKQHILTSKSRSRKRSLKGTVLVSKADQASLRKMLPN